MRVFVFDAMTGDGLRGAEVFLLFPVEAERPVPLERENAEASVFLCSPQLGQPLRLEVRVSGRAVQTWVFAPDEWSEDSDINLVCHCR